LVLPLFAMRLTDQVEWDLIDFLILGSLLVGIGATLELVVWKTASAFYRAGAAVALGAVFLLLVVNGAVGVIGSSHNDANLMFAGVLGVAVVGAVIARFRAAGMARAMIAAAIAQLLVAVVALMAGSGSSGPIWPFDILLATVFFAGLWILSARLFRKAAGLPSE
jgi:hypothetical protein